jgi:cytochrome P450 family 4
LQGHDSSTSCISLALHALANSPQVQKMAFDEQLSMFGDDLAKEPSSGDLQNMYYLERVIKETLRMYPSVPIYARETIEDFPLKGILYQRCK